MLTSMRLRHRFFVFTSTINMPFSAVSLSFIFTVSVFVTMISFFLPFVCIRSQLIFFLGVLAFCHTRQLKHEKLRNNSYIYIYIYLMHFRVGAFVCIVQTVPGITRHTVNSYQYDTLVVPFGVRHCSTEELRVLSENANSSSRFVR